MNSSRSSHWPRLVMTPVVPGSQGLMRANSFADKGKAWSLLRVEAIQVSVRATEDPRSSCRSCSIRGPPSRNISTTACSKNGNRKSEALRYAVAGIYGLIEDAGAAPITVKEQRGITRTDNHLETMLQTLVHKANDENLRSVECENLLLRNFGDVI